MFKQVYNGRGYHGVVLEKKGHAPVQCEDKYSRTHVPTESPFFFKSAGKEYVSLSEYFEPNDGIFEISRVPTNV